MAHSVVKTEPFNNHAVTYDEWYDQYPFVFQSEVEAIREMLPAGESYGIEVGLGTGRFSVALGIKEGIEPAKEMRKIAFKRGIEVMDAVAENLPYKDLHFDFVLMTTSINYFYDLHAAFREANRVLKREGRLVIGFIVKDSVIGKFYEQKRHSSEFQRQATFYSVNKIVSELRLAGFKNPEFSQTLFGNLEEINDFEPAEPGYDQGSFIVIKAIKK